MAIKKFFNANCLNICLFLETNGLHKLSTHRQKYVSYPYLVTLNEVLMKHVFRIYDLQVLKRLCYNTNFLLQI